MYEALDGLIGINVIYYVEWPRFAEFVGHPEWLDDTRLQTPVDRARNRELIDAELRPWLRQQPKQALYEAAQRAKIPFALINTPADLVAAPQLKARDYWVDQPVTMPGAPFKLSETPWQLKRLAPRLGEHSAEVLAERFGFGDADVARLRERGVV
jgi:crotonobetainyl-CoA:carnitine CoA-transferase CaiB-like acyl-CoA transferase